MAERAVTTIKAPEAKQTCPNSCKQNPVFNFSESPAERILQLQRTAGNQAVQRLIKSGALQAKLKIGQANDIYEQQADRVAEQVLRIPKPQGSNGMRVFKKMVDNPIQRECPGCKSKKDDEEKILQAKENSSSTPEVTPELESSISAIRGGGQPLPESTRAFFETRFGHDFRGVRTHSGAAAEQSAKNVNAHAYTVGSNIVFGAGRFAPETHEGRRLIAHELTHVIQQRAAEKRLQCKKLTREERGDDLKSDFLRDDQRLQKAYDNDPLMEFGETSPIGGVKTLQRALKELHYDLSISFAKTGDADGIFGSETKKVVLQFQTDQSLTYKDGIVGRETLQALDNIFQGAPEPCKIRFIGGVLNPQKRITFIQNNFSHADRPEAKKVLDDLCEVTGNLLSFESEKELRDEVLKRFKISQYLRESQVVGAFGYPENARNCAGKTGNSLTDAQVNINAREYWNGPILEQRSFIKNKHYYFELSDPKGKENAYQALKLLFVPHNNICDRTLIHCDTLITLVETIAYADTIGEKQFNEKIRTGQLSMWLTYDGMSILETETGITPVSISYQKIVPGSKQDLVIGDHVTFWNHLAYDAISSKNPGPWRLENAVLVDRDTSGQDLFEGHGAPLLEGTIKPGTELNMLAELMKVYNIYTKDALSIADRVDHNVPGAEDEMRNKYPQVKKYEQWWIEELDDNDHRNRPHRSYILREITDPYDPELIGLHDPNRPTQMNYVERPKESQ